MKLAFRSRPAWPIVCALVVACDIGTLHPPASLAPTALTISPSFQLGPGAATAYSRVDNVVVRFLADDELRLEESRPLDPLLSEVRINFSVPLNEASELFTVELELRMGAQVIFRGSDNATLTTERSTDVEVDLEPVITGLSCSGPLISFASFGDTQTLTAAATVASGDVVGDVPVGWSSANQSVATVNSAGLVTAVSDGSTQIVCSAGGAFDSRAVQVFAVPSTITVTRASDTLSVGFTRQFVATLHDARNNLLVGRTVVWTSTDETIATIGNATGLANGVSPGSVGIRATSTSHPNVFGSAVLNVIAYTPLLRVIFAGSGGGSVTSTPAGISITGSATTCGAGQCGALLPHNTTLTLTATPNGTSTFTGWSGEGCSGTGTCVVTMSQARTVTANFGTQTRLLTVNYAGNGSGTVTGSGGVINCASGPCSASVTLNAVVTLTATANGSSTFAGWSGEGCAGIGTCVVTMSQARTVTATFTGQTRLLTVTFTGTGGGTVSGSGGTINCGGNPCSASININTVVILTATANASSNFTGWSGEGCTGIGTCTVTMSQARTVFASFADPLCTTSGHTLGTQFTSAVPLTCVLTRTYTISQQTIFTMRGVSPSFPSLIAPLFNPSTGYWYQPTAQGVESVVHAIVAAGTHTLAAGRDIGTAPGSMTVTTTINPVPTCDQSVYATLGTTWATSLNACATYTPSGFEGQHYFRNIYLVVPPGKTLTVHMTSSAFLPLLEMRDPDFILRASTEGTVAGTVDLTWPDATPFVILRMTSRTPLTTGAFTLTIDP